MIGNEMEINDQMIFCFAFLFFFLTLRVIQNCLAVDKTGFDPDKNIQEHLILAERDAIEMKQAEPVPLCYDFQKVLLMSINYSSLNPFSKNQRSQGEIVCF